MNIKYFPVKLLFCEALLKFCVTLVNCEVLTQTVKKDPSLNKKLIEYLNGNYFKWKLLGPEPSGVLL